jgi:hypothetical protein
VLDALITTRHLKPSGESANRAVRWLTQQQQDDGSWLNFSEQWFSVNQPTVPNRCDNYTTAPALRALLHAGGSALDRQILAATTWLLQQQDGEGCWYYNRPDGCKHVWCTADAIDALAEVRSHLKQHRAELTAMLRNDSASVVPARSRLAFLVAIIFACLAAIGFRREVVAAARAFLSFLRLQASSLTVNILSSAIYALAVSLVVVAWRYLRKRQRT